jgi:hypothetical protein
MLCPIKIDASATDGSVRLGRLSPQYQMYAFVLHNLTQILLFIVNQWTH